MPPLKSFAKRFVKFGLKSVLFGIGVGAVLAVVIFYVSRPVPIRTKAITAKYDYVSTDSNNKIQINYIVENNTSQNYEINSYNIKTYANLAREASLIPVDGYVKFDSDVMIPPHKSVEIPLVLNGGGNALYFSPYKNNAESPGASKQDVAAFHYDVLNYATSTFGNLSGFTMIDTTNNTEIDFPIWNASSTAF